MDLQLNGNININAGPAAAQPGGLRYGLQPEARGEARGAAQGNINAAFAAAQPGGLRYGLQPGARGVARVNAGLPELIAIARVRDF